MLPPHGAWVIETSCAVLPSGDEIYLSDTTCLSVSVSVTGKMSWGHITPVRMVGRLT